MLLITVNPDLERERRAFVTPIVRGAARMAIIGWQIFALSLLTALAFGCYAFLDTAWAPAMLLFTCVCCYGLYRSDVPPLPPPHRTINTQKAAQ